ncbi:hypothetical protein PIB30_030913 [Stylosanthes scabra]|uniref:Uncharacterized protein n=1 Tax=Stylosanthes scabra TaxID=79078 RepID=A0ABU6ZAF3_9FABA|nr:hypothetical protein [Stylosanthes scabra]
MLATAITFKPKNESPESPPPSMPPFHHNKNNTPVRWTIFSTALERIRLSTPSETLPLQLSFRHKSSPSTCWAYLQIQGKIIERD